MSFASSLISPAKRSIKKFTSHLSHMDYHNTHKAKAFSAIKVIEKYSDIKLTPELKKQADDYAASVLGGTEYAPWLYVYSLVSGRFKEGWMPDNFF